MGLYTTSSTSGGLYGSKTDTSTSRGLYGIATKTGLQQRADEILKTKGETPTIFSGGFISDVFDALNLLQYGVAGTIQGKGFAEGVKTRASFSDQDQLGKYGLLGTIGGIGLDIAFDPLTYIAPWTIAKKIPGVVKVAGAVKKAAFGEMVSKTVGGKLIQELQGGTKLGKDLATKFVYMFGKDPIYRNIYEKSVRNIGIGVDNLGKMTKGIIDLPQETAAKLLTKDATGRMARVGLSTLKNTLSANDYAKVETAWNEIDRIGKEAVDLGLLSKAKYEENLGEYIKNAYKEYEEKKAGKIFGFKKAKVEGIKARKDLTPEEMAKLGQIDNPAYLLFKSVFDLTKDVENAKLFKLINGRFASDVE